MAGKKQKGLAEFRASLEKSIRLAGISMDELDDDGGFIIEKIIELLQVAESMAAAIDPGNEDQPQGPLRLPKAD